MKLEELAKLLFRPVPISFSSCKVFSLPSLVGDFGVKTIPRFPVSSSISLREMLPDRELG